MYEIVLQIGRGVYNARRRCDSCSIQAVAGLRCSSERFLREAIRYGIVQNYEKLPAVTRLEMRGHIVELDPYHGRMPLCNRLHAEGVATAAWAPVEDLEEAGLAA